MKNLFGRVLVFTFLLHADMGAFAQAFHFLQTAVTLTKSTAQSPAHWYIEIYNDVNVDTVLRWKADLSGIPPGWVITYDDGSNYYSGVSNGDSADFVLQDSLPLPQKLIIGAFTNNIPAFASAYFDIYNPADTATPTTITYNFNIYPATGLISPLTGNNLIRVCGDMVFFSFPKTMSCQIISLSGQVVFTGIVANGTLPITFLERGAYLISVSDGGVRYVKRFAK